jgi:hypothetical protein
VKYLDKPLNAEKLKLLLQGLPTAFTSWNTPGSAARVGKGTFLETPSGRKQKEGRLFPTLLERLTL